MRDDIKLTEEKKRELKSHIDMFKRIILNIFSRFVSTNQKDFTQYNSCKLAFNMNPSDLENMVSRGNEILGEIENKVDKEISAEKTEWYSKQTPPPATAGQQIMGSSAGWQPKPWKPTFNEEDNHIDQSLFENFSNYL
jgi:hypothetical protein